MTETSQEAVSPTPELVAPNAPDYSAEVERLRAHNNQVIGEKRKVQEELDQLKTQVQSMQTEQKVKKTEKLVQQEEWKPLWEEANRTNQELQQRISGLERELSAARQEAQFQSMEARFASAASSAGVISPQHLFNLHRDRFKLSEDGSPVVLNGGVEQDFQSFLEGLKQPGSGFEYHFKPSGVGGMGAGGMAAVGGQRTSPAPTGNPYLTRNIVEMTRLELDQPELAAQLKAEAMSAKR